MKVCQKKCCLERGARIKIRVRCGYVDPAAVGAFYTGVRLRGMEAENALALAAKLSQELRRLTSLAMWSIL